MAKHVLTRHQQISGLKQCLKSKRTPPWLKPSIKRFLEKLEGKRK